MDCVRSWAVPMATATGCLHGPVDHRRTTVAVFPSISITSLVSVRFAYTFPSPIPPAPCTTTHSPPRTAACLSPHETRPYSDTPCLRSQQTRWNRAGEPGSHRHSARRRIPRMRPNKKHQGRAALPSHRPVLRAPTYCSHATSKGYARRCIRPCPALRGTAALPITQRYVHLQADTIESIFARAITSQNSLQGIPFEPETAAGRSCCRSSTTARSWSTRFCNSSKVQLRRKSMQYPVSTGPQTHSYVTSPSLQLLQY